MRIRTALLLGLAILAGSASGHAATAPLPRFAGKTNLSAAGSGAALVSLSKPVTVDVAKPSSWIRFSPATWYGATGVFLDRVNVRGADRVGLFYIRLAAKTGCDLAGKCTAIEAIAMRAGADRSYKRPEVPTLRLPAGTYRVYVLGGGRPTKVTLLLGGLTDSISIVARTPVQTAFHQRNQAPLDDIAAHPEHATSTFSELVPSGALGFDVPHAALLAGGMWRTRALKDTPEVPHSVMSCWYRSTSDEKLPDYWWQDPAMLLAQASPPPSVCSGANLGVDRVFASITKSGWWSYSYDHAPTLERGQTAGAFVIQVSFLDAQA
jgi:hypothetical protein